VTSVFMSFRYEMPHDSRLVQGISWRGTKILLDQIVTLGVNLGWYKQLNEQEIIEIGQNPKEMWI